MLRKLGLGIASLTAMAVHRRKRRAERARPVRDGEAFAFIAAAPGAVHSDDDLAEQLAETFLESATSGEEQGEESFNALVPEELGGPFLEDDEVEDGSIDEIAITPPDARATPRRRTVRNPA